MNPFIIVSLATSLAAHAPVTTTGTGGGTCRANSGCHHFADQCVIQNDCAPGYVPNAVIRDTDDPACPWKPSVSCDGECTCVPGRGGGSSSGGGHDGGVCTDGGSSSGGSSSSSGSSSGIGSGSSSGSSSGGGGCDCPSGDECVRGFCAGPCPSDGWCPHGYECTGGYCVPDCLVTGCPTPSTCDPATGQCADVGSDGGVTAMTDAGFDGSASGGSSSGASSSGGSSSGASGSSSGSGEPWDAAATGGDAGADGDTPIGEDRGCGCHAAGSDGPAHGPGAIAAAALGLGLMLRRRRR